MLSVSSHPNGRGWYWISPSWEFSREFLKYWLSSKREDIHWRRDRLSTPVFLDFLCGLAGKESTCNLGDLGLIPGLGRSPGEWKGYPLQYSGLENSTDSIVHGVAESDTTEWLSLSPLFKDNILSLIFAIFNLASGCLFLAFTSKATLDAGTQPTQSEVTVGHAL